MIQINSEATELKLLEDLMVIIGERPILVSLVREALMDGETRSGRKLSGRWQRVSSLDGFDLRQLGFHTACRSHGSGIAEYVATVAFSQVYDARHDRFVPVAPN